VSDVVLIMIAFLEHALLEIILRWTWTTPTTHLESWRFLIPGFRNPMDKADNLVHFARWRLYVLSALVYWK